MRGTEQHGEKRERSDSNVDDLGEETLLMLISAVLAIPEIHSTVTCRLVSDKLIRRDDACRVSTSDNPTRVHLSPRCFAFLVSLSPHSLSAWVKNEGVPAYPRTRTAQFIGIPNAGLLQRKGSRLVDKMEIKLTMHPDEAKFKLGFSSVHTKGNCIAGWACRARDIIVFDCDCLDATLQLCSVHGRSDEQLRTNRTDGPAVCPVCEGAQSKMSDVESGEKGKDGGDDDEN